MHVPWEATGLDTLSEIIAGHARQQPKKIAYQSADVTMDWGDYDGWSNRLAITLLGLGLKRGDCVGLLLPDTWEIHVAFVACEKAGLVAVGISARAGQVEAAHLLGTTSVKAIISTGRRDNLDLASLLYGLAGKESPPPHIIISGPLDQTASLSVVGNTPAGMSPEQLKAAIASRRMGPEDIFLLNSTSGTTGMPKCVMQTQRRWFSFARAAQNAAQLDASDVFLCAVPASVGFGLWSGHFTPTLLGSPTVLLARFSVEALLEAIQRHKVSVLSAVSTQLVMMVNHPRFEEYDLRSLKVLFTGGEAVPYEKAIRFEAVTGAKVLQFYGSNEAGAISVTTVRDPSNKRLTTAGRLLNFMKVKLIDEKDQDVTYLSRGRPICTGPMTSNGYFNNPEANRNLYTSDGWMKIDDIVEIDDEGYVKVIGRAGDFIIRGGKNISAAAVENAVMSYPGVHLAAAVAMPDDTFGEKVCAYVTMQEGATMTLEKLASHLLKAGISKENIPERLEIRGELPTVSGGKIDKKSLREEVRRALSGTG